MDSVYPSRPSRPDRPLRPEVMWNLLWIPYTRSAQAEATT